MSGLDREMFNFIGLLVVIVCAAIAAGATGEDAFWVIATVAAFVLGIWVGHAEVRS